jgi:alanine racemase
MIKARIDLARIRENCRAIGVDTGLPVIAVVKADAYGVGIVPVSEAISDLVLSFGVFSLAEVLTAHIAERTGKPTIVLGPTESLSPSDYLPHRARPVVVSAEAAAALKAADPIVCVDTGMQRFACSPDQLDAILSGGLCREAMTHGIRREHADALLRLTEGFSLFRHAAGTKLIRQGYRGLDAIRPGLALYDKAIDIRINLHEVRESRGPVGYSAFDARHHGVILCGYQHGLRPGPCLVNGGRRDIVEVGMQSAYVRLDAQDRHGDEVALLGPELDADEIATAWATPPHEVLLSLLSTAHKTYDA